MSTTLYVRLPDELKAWLDHLAEESGLSLAKVCEALLTDQRQRHLKIMMELRVQDQDPPR